MLKIVSNVYFLTKMPIVSFFYGLTYKDFNILAMQLLEKLD